MADQYPKAMYKGSYTADKINGEQATAADKKQEDKLRRDGFIDGPEFFSKPPEHK